MARNTRRKALGVALVCGAILVGILYWQVRGRPVGIYLIGGEAGLEIVREPNGKLRSSQDGDGWRIGKTPTGRLSIERGNGYGPDGEFLVHEAWELTPSRTISGDWDLVATWANRSGRDTVPGELHGLTEPVTAYLHRVDDRRVMEFGELVQFANGRWSQNPIPDPEKRMLPLAEAMIAAHPEDVLVRFLYWDALYRCGEWTLLREDMAAWDARCRESPIPFVRQGYEYALWQTAARLGQAAGEDGGALVDELLSNQTPLDRRIKLMPELLNAKTVTPLTRSLSPRRVPDFLGFQSAAKVTDVMAYFLMIEGRRGEALDLLAANYYLGQQMSQQGTLICRLIGIACRAIAIKGLSVYALNACSTAGDFSALRDRLRWLDEREATTTAEDVLKYETARWMKFADSDVGLNVTEALRRKDVVDAAWRNLLAGSAARERLLSQGAFPQRAEEFEPWLDKLPVDPFTPASLKFFSRPDLFTVYSVGPDGRDEQATVAYDPTNGSVSAGDIVLEVPARAKYPFPREGLRARTAADVARVFPNGLPPDPFANNRNRGLSVTMDTTPIYIYSFGPDSDEGGQVSGYETKKVRRPEVGYDPTNGVTSDGDLFVPVLP